MADFSPINKGFAVTPADNTKFTQGPCRGLYVAVSGAVVVLNVDASTTTYTGLVAGVVHPIAAYGINSTNTTATGIVACY